MKQNKSGCYICGDRQWMVLQQNPIDPSHDLVAPCLGCSPTKSLKQITLERGIELIRGPDQRWKEISNKPVEMH